MAFRFVAPGFGAIVAVSVVPQMNLGDGTKEDRLISVEVEPLWQGSRTEKLSPEITTKRRHGSSASLSIAESLAGSVGGKGVAMYDMPIEELRLSLRTYNCLVHAQIHTVGEVLEKKEEDLLKIRNFGAKSLEELKHRLAERGFI